MRHVKVSGDAEVLIVMDIIKHNSDTPMYIQLETILEEAISSGQYKAGDKLPSESELCKQYGVSRITVRQTLTLLIQKQLLYSVHGKGTFVKAPAISHDLSKIVRFGATLQQKGLNGYTVIHSYQPLVASEAASAKVGCDCGNLNLVGYTHKNPIVYYQSYIRAELCEEMHRAAKEIEQTNTAFSSYDLYDKLGIKLRRVEQTIGAVTADETLRKIFTCPKGEAFIVLESVYYSQEDVPLEYKIAHYRANIYSFHLQREL